MTAPNGIATRSFDQAAADLQRTALRQAQHLESPKEIKRISREFEAMFLNLVLKAMRKTVPEDGLFHGGNAENIYRSMLDNEYAQIMAEQGHTGIGKTLEDFLIRNIGVASKRAGLDSYKAQGLPHMGKKATIEGNSQSQVDRISVKSREG